VGPETAVARLVNSAMELASLSDPLQMPGRGVGTDQCVSDMAGRKNGASYGRHSSSSDVRERPPKR